jgi:hypothetical protein
MEDPRGFRHGFAVGWVDNLAHREADVEYLAEPTFAQVCSPYDYRQIATANVTHRDQQLFLGCRFEDALKLG